MLVQITWNFSLMLLHIYCLVWCSLKSHEASTWYSCKSISHMMLAKVTWIYMRSWRGGKLFSLTVITWSWCAPKDSLSNVFSHHSLERLKEAHVWICAFHTSKLRWRFKLEYEVSTIFIALHMTWYIDTLNKMELLIYTSSYDYLVKVKRAGWMQLELEWPFVPVQ